MSRENDDCARISPSSSPETAVRQEFEQFPLFLIDFYCAHKYLFIMWNETALCVGRLKVRKTIMEIFSLSFDEKFMTIYRSDVERGVVYAKSKLAAQPVKKPKL